MLKLLSLVDALAKKPEQFVDTVSASKNSALLEDTTKSLYVLAKKSEPKKTNSLDQLFLDGFDKEQIWEQLQLLNKPVLQHIDKEIKSLAKQPIQNKRGASDNTKKPSKKLKVYEEEDLDSLEEEDFEGEGLEDAEDFGDEEGLEDGLDDDELLGDEDMENGDDDDDLGSDEELGDEDMEEGEDDGEEDDGESDEDDEKVGGKERFSLDELDEFAEREMEADEELGALLDRAYDEDEEDDGKKKGKKGKKGSHVLESSDEEDEDEQEAEKAEEAAKPKTRYETEMSQMKEKIKALEDAAVAPKSWTMVGEVSYKERPTNSLLAEDLFFDYSSKAPPVITQERTASLEDIIKQRIAKRLWDDVIRKTETVKEHKPTVELDSSKNTEGLAAVYENQYLKSVHGVQGPESNTTKLQKEAQNLFKELCGKLDSLSHFHYTPKQAVAEAHVKTNAPALAVEEATPTAVSSTTLIAPQEVLHAPRVLKDKEEMSKQENKAHRRHRKEAAKKQKEATPQATGPISQADALAELKKDRRVTIVDSKAASQKTSSAKFFKTIQDQAQNPTPAKKKGNNGPENAKSYKL